MGYVYTQEKKSFGCKYIILYRMGFNMDYCPLCHVRIILFRFGHVIEKVPLTPCGSNSSADAHSLSKPPAGGGPKAKWLFCHLKYYFGPDTCTNAEYTIHFSH